MSEPKKVSEMNEQEMREAEAARPKNMDELAGYIAQLTERRHDYGTCVYAMSLAAVAAFNFVADKLGVTGFQADCADMDVLRRTRCMEHGFTIVNANDLLYPQYDVEERVREWAKRTRIALAPAARKLAEEEPDANPDVVAHWKKLAAAEEAK